MSESNPNSLHDNAIGWFFIALVGLGIVWLIWYFNSTELRNFVRWVRYGEMWLIHWIVPENYAITYNGKAINWHQGYDIITQYKPSQITNEHIALFTALAMQPLKYVLAGFMGLGALWCIFDGPRTKFRRDLGLEGLIAYQSHNFPVIQPFVDFNPSKMPPRPPGSPVPADLPAFAEALGPEEWLAYNSIPVPDGKVKESAANKAFQKQLIARWKGWKYLKPYQQIMLASFALKAARKRDEADTMLGRLACCWSHEKGLKLGKDGQLLSDARKVLRNKDLSEKTLKECNNHAFVTTALLRALQFAREEGGVLAPAMFVWLRAYDRTLWYPLNNLGRQSLHMEAIGAMAHFKAERLTKRPIPVPKVEFAVRSITEYMASSDARPIPALDYKGSKKRAIKKAA